MTPGFRTISSNGDVVQIDQDFKNFALKEKATITTDTNLSTASGKESSYKSVTFSNSFTYPIIATYSTTPVFMIEQTSTGATFVAKGLSGQSITYYVFDQPPTTPPSTGFGAKIMLANGETAYNSNLKYMRVKGQATFSAAMWDASSGGHGVGSVVTGMPSGMVLAGVQCLPGVRQKATSNVGTPGAVPALTSAGGVYQLSNQLAVYAMAVFEFTNSVGFDTGGTNGTWLALDVTGY